MFRPRFSVVVPVFNGIEHLRTCLESVTAAIGRYQNAELIVVDNGSTDGSYELLLANYAATAQIFQVEDVTIGALRNYGARVASGDYLSFIDSDCVIPQDYFERVASVFASVDAAAVGSMCDLPTPAHWIEKTWHMLHAPVKDGYVNYLNSGNFVVKRAVFERIGGFDETLTTGEDAELGVRLGAAGFKIYESQEIKAIHLRNPKTLRQFVSRQVWHGLGMFGSAKIAWFDKPLLLTFAHLLLTAAGAINLFVSWTGLGWRVVAFAVSLALAPVAAVIYRSIHQRRLQRPLRSILLYWLYLNSRVCALFLIACGRMGGRSKLR